MLRLESWLSKPLRLMMSFSSSDTPVNKLWVLQSTINWAVCHTSTIISGNCHALLCSVILFCLTLAFELSCALRLDNLTLDSSLDCGNPQGILCCSAFVVFNQHSRLALEARRFKSSISIPWTIMLFYLFRCSSTTWAAVRCQSRCAAWCSGLASNKVAFRLGWVMLSVSQNPFLVKTCEKSNQCM